MIDIHLDRLSHSGEGYVFHVAGNEGEEELTVILSPSQAWATPMLIVTASVDDGMQVLHQSDGMVPDAELPKLLMEKLYEWASYGIKPTEKQDAEINDKIGTVLAALLEHFGYDLEQVKLSDDDKPDESDPLLN